VNPTIVEAATVHMVPIGLPLWVKLVQAPAIATLMGLSIGFAAECSDPPFRTTGDVEDQLEITLLASIPKNGHQARPCS
jgi:capsular polysaccharide biosynthesis protein